MTSGYEVEVVSYFAMTQYSQRPRKLQTKLKVAMSYGQLSHIVSVS